MSNRVVLFEPPRKGRPGRLLPALFFKAPGTLLRWRMVQLDVFRAKPDAQVLRKRLRRIVSAVPEHQSLHVVHSSVLVKGSAPQTACWYFCACTDGAFWDQERVGRHAVPFRLASDGSLEYPPEDATFIGPFPGELQTAVLAFAA